MPARTYVVRFPTGTEHWFGEFAPKIGDVVARRGTRYVVEGIREEDGEVVITLEEEVDVRSAARLAEDGGPPRADGS